MQLTARDAARLLQISERMLYRLLERGELNATRVNEQWRFNRVDLLEFAATRRMEISAELLAELDPPQAPPSLAEALRQGGVHHGITGDDKTSILRAVVDRLPLPPTTDRDLLHRVLLAREALGSTGFGNGLAIPHPRNPIVLRVQQPAAAICYLERPIDFGALDGQPVHTLITLVSPSTRAHLHLLAVLATVLHESGVHGRLAARAGLDELLPEIERGEAALAQRRAGAGA
jgi:PTS system nitrogen regulatory IIA component